ncbi:methyltransferase, partial [Aureimonas sp. N4]|uniref:methyltransferase n=1 Tax=Aureimonas sp. N4 TaxID=1638165 RepID=UPI0009EC45A4
KLTKAQRKDHAEAEAILTKDRLTDDEREFVLRNWHEGANFINGAAGAFFTPYDLASDFAIDAGTGRVIDLCAGIGGLAYHVVQRGTWNAQGTSELTCVEINPRYVEVGRKLVPEARWINADVFDWHALELGHFDVAIGNPPFGRVRRSGNAPRYRGPEFEFHIIDIAAELADRGAFLIPQGSASFRYSGAPYFDRLKTGKGYDFQSLTGWEMDGGVGIDTSLFRDQWKDTAITCEVACFDFTEARERQREAAERRSARLIEAASAAQPTHQLAFL